MLNRTAGEASRDGTICHMYEMIRLVKMKLKKFEDHARFKRDYRHAERYEQIHRMLEKTQAEAVEQNKQREGLGI